MNSKPGGRGAVLIAVIVVALIVLVAFLAGPLRPGSKGGGSAPNDASQPATSAEVANPAPPGGGSAGQGAGGSPGP